MTEIDRFVLESAAYDAGCEDQDIRLDYSGRGMYGRTCVGIVGTVETYGEFLLELASTDDEEDGSGLELARDLNSRVSVDGMGRASIYYFPGITVTKDSDKGE